ncbi:reverse transcriptase domain-containing protein [Aerosakkonemataceae cyanobacterium BLCC-F50]|uniref:Reverse transcriptase domain-containing protein n=1 Tax=Floridaenema flaviceps BLCC-F50 TaxID=3153642 RepID=A0ABV4XJS0_9CYAN
MPLFLSVENQGKKTAGVDGIRQLSPAARLELANHLKITGKSKPTRRVWIPKPGSEEKRPLGIPIMYDRALQAVIKAALEPEWEAQFEPNSYGFRPGRSCHDAIAQIKLATQQKAKYVLDADIAKCFDRINHDKLLQKLNLLGQVRRQIKAWLKSGVIDQRVFGFRVLITPSQKASKVHQEQIRRIIKKHGSSPQITLR